MPFTNDNDNDAVSGDLLRMAINEAFSILGPVATREAIEVLENAGVKLDQNSIHHLSDIRRELAFLFGEEGTDLLIERLKKALKKHL